MAYTLYMDSYKMCLEFLGFLFRHFLAWFWGDSSIIFLEDQVNHNADQHYDYY